MNKKQNNTLSPSKKYTEYHWILTLLAITGVIYAIFIVLSIHSKLPSYYPYISLLHYCDSCTNAAIAKNLTLGIGQYFHPAYGLCRMPVFYDHLALGFIIQSAFFNLLGIHWYSLHILGFIVYCITMMLVCYIWKKLHHDITYNMLGLPIGLWLLIPTNLLFYPMNMLEPLAALFSLIAVICLFVSKEYGILLNTKHIFLLVLAAIALDISLLIIGPLSLFVFSVDIALFFAYKQHSFYYHCKRTAILLIISSFFLGLLFHYVPSALTNAIQFTKHQLIASVLSERQDSFYIGWSRFHLIAIMIGNIFPLLCLTCFMIFTKKLTFSTLLKRRSSVFFAILTLTSSLPIMISSKQFSHYLIQSNLYLLIFTLSYLTHPIQQTIYLTHKKNNYKNTIKSKLYLLISSILCLSSISSLVFFLVHPIAPDEVSKIGESIFKVTGPIKKISYQSNMSNTNPYTLESIMLRNYQISWCNNTDESDLLYFYNPSTFHQVSTFDEKYRLALKNGNIILYKKLN